jgi:hypothetical protein
MEPSHSQKVGRLLCNPLGDARNYRTLNFQGA